MYKVYHIVHPPFYQKQLITIYRCECTRQGTSEDSRKTDRIVRADITPTNLKYITAFRLTQHNGDTALPTQYTVEVGDVNCNEPAPQTFLV